MHHDPNALLLAQALGLPFVQPASDAAASRRGESPILRGWLRRSRRDHLTPSQGGRR
jgi:hypothetical protein